MGATVGRRTRRDSNRARKKVASRSARTVTVLACARETAACTPRGNAYINGGGFDLMAGEPFAPGIVALVTAEGSARRVADGLAFPTACS